MKPGDWVFVDIKKAEEILGWENSDEYYRHSYFQNRDIAEGRIVKNPTNNSQEGPTVEFPSIAERERREYRVPWDAMEPSMCDEHGRKLYHDPREQWECPFCNGEYSAT